MEKKLDCDETRGKGKTSKKDNNGNGKGDCSQGRLIRT